MVPYIIVCGRYSKSCCYRKRRRVRRWKRWKGTRRRKRRMRRQPADPPPSLPRNQQIMSAAGSFFHVGSQMPVIYAK